jgi:hypothetical protein
MMRSTKWLAAAVLVTSLAGCVETMDAGYAAPSYGYGYGGGYSSGYYSQPAFYSAPVVYSQTRYVPVPTPQYADRKDHRWDGDHRADARHDEPRHVERPATNPPPTTHNTVSSGSHNDGNRHDGNRDSDHRG